MSLKLKRQKQPEESLVLARESKMRRCSNQEESMMEGQGAPGREPVFSEEEKKHMMAYAYRKQEEMKKLEADEEDAYMNSEWADPQSLKRSFQGLNDISWRPK